MYRSLSLGLAFLSIYFLSACAAPTAIRKPEPVPAGTVYYGDVLNITTPNSEGWHLPVMEASQEKASRHRS